MSIRGALPALALSVLALALPGGAVAAEECSLQPRSACFGVESVDAGLSTTQAGAHPDLTLDVAVKTDPLSPTNVFGLHDAYAPTRNVRINTPPGLIGDPNVLGVPQLCTTQELISFNEPGGGCPNGSQIGISKIAAFSLEKELPEPLFMMAPPGGDVVARIGTIAGIFPTFIDFRVRSESDYGLTAEVTNGPAQAKLIGLKSTLWGVPADHSHDNERCTATEVFAGCVTSPSRPPGSRPLPFLTNPTRCGEPLKLGVNASSWVEAGLDPAKEVEAAFPTITGCDKLPFGPGLTIEPTTHRAGAPTGLDVTITLPASDGVNVLEPAQTRDIRIDLPAGLAINTDASDGLGVCSAEQAGFGRREDAHCPDAAKLAATEFDVSALPRRMKGAIYLREPEPGNPFRIWVVADDLGAHVKLPGQLEIDKVTGQIESIVLDAPQVPLREVKLLFKSGFRAPLVNPLSCGTYRSHYEFTSWSGGPPAVGDTAMSIDEGCEAGGFHPKLSAGSTDASGGAFSPFTFTITREDGEQNLVGLQVSLPRGMAASFAGVARCEEADAATGACPAASRIGRVTAAVGAGTNPLWVPQPGKRPTGVYLSGPYKGAPLSIVAVVPKQAGPFDFGDEVVRSAVYVDPLTAQATAVADPLPQRIEGIPILYRTLNVTLDRPGFTLNPTGCAQKETTATLVSVGGRTAAPSSGYAATDCASLGFRPRLGLKLRGGTKRGEHPKFSAVFRPRGGDANASEIVVRLPHSAFLDQAHIRTICTRVQFAAGAGNGAECPAGAVYGHVTAYTPILDQPLEGPVFLRSSNHNLPDLVMALHGPASLPIDIEAVGRVDSVKGGIRSSFESIPDAPLTKVVLEMQGGKKGLIVNSTDLCLGKHRADVSLTGHNGKALSIHPELEAKCGGKR